MSVLTKLQKKTVAPPRKSSVSKPAAAVKAPTAVVSTVSGLTAD